MLTGLLRPARRAPRADPAPPAARSSAPVPPADTAAARAGGPIWISYAPDPDGDPDPGEIVWTWVPFEDDPRQGKDRPVLLVARNGGSLVGLMLSSKNHDDDPGGWHPLGSGPWDREARPAWVRLDRVIDVNPSAMRREGATLDQPRFATVAGKLRIMHGWS